MDIDGKKLIAARKKAGLSQNALAKSSGVSRSYIRKLEADEANNPSMEKLTMLATALALNVDTLQVGPVTGEVLKSEKNGKKYQMRSVGGRRQMIEVPS